MITGPRAGAASKTDFVANARAAWGEALPDWVLALAEAASRTSGAAVAKRLGYANSAVSTVINAKYRGDMARVEEVVRGALMGATVDCPVLGEIGRDRCRAEQREPFRATSAHRAQLYHHCTIAGRCPHSKATAEGGACEHD